MGKNCQLRNTESHKRIPQMGNYFRVNGSVERNVNGLHQTDIRIRLMDKSFHLWDPLWIHLKKKSEDIPPLSDSSPTRIHLWEIIFR